ncbi:hypothetical protein EMIT07CA2_210081 [Brevibacillus sp. IT-7CA2]|uniref:hypothetical protein n=1 Tax=Brevibacillus sp. IT-7CA2 TaxID=3026436 RepID=UPI0039E0FF63
MGVKVVVTCDNCGLVSEFKPVTVGNHAYISKEFNKKAYFTVSDVSIESDVSVSLDDDYVSKLVESDSVEEITRLLDYEIADNISIDSKLNEVRIDCKQCGEYITLTDF